MKYLKKYKIPFSGLATGKHNFEFDVDDQFFACFEHSIVKKGDMKALVEIQKQENMLIVNFDIKGIMQLTCDVCLQEFNSPVSITERVFVKFSHDEWDQGSEEIIVLSHHDHELDISGLLYEYINVHVPYYTKCSQQGIGKECDPEMLSRLKNNETEETESEEGLIDPRWEALKKIKKN